MTNRKFGDLVAGLLACVSVLGGCFALLREAEGYARRQRRRAAQRWSLPHRDERYRSPEDDCRHCGGSGACPQCAPGACRVCRGAGLQPHDGTVVSRLCALWDGAA